MGNIPEYTGKPGNTATSVQLKKATPRDPP